LRVMMREPLQGDRPLVAVGGGAPKMGVIAQSIIKG